MAETDPRENGTESVGVTMARRDFCLFLVGGAATLFLPGFVSGDPLSFNGAEVNAATSGENEAAGPPEGVCWWHWFPSFTQGDPTLFFKADARMDIYGMADDPTWGTYAQRLSELESKSGFEQLKRKGARVITYIEGFGDCMMYAVALNRLSDGSFERSRDDPRLTRVIRSHWDWANPKLPAGNAFRWVGIHNTVNDEDFVMPYFSSRRLGLPAPRYPDGRSAVGWNSGVVYPLSAKLYDACGSKDINGRLHPEFSPTEGVNSLNPTIGRPKGPVAGLYPADPRIEDVSGAPASGPARTVYCGVISVHKDLSAPFWREYIRISIREIVKAGMDGVWCDNWSPWDNFGYPPVQKAFGDWSRHRFHRSYRPQQPHFDVRRYLKRKAIEFGAKDSSRYNDPAWQAERWLEDPVWNAFKAFRQIAARGDLKAFYDVIHQEADRLGRPDFCINGNDIPLYGLGWVRDEWLDMVSCELTPGWHMGTGSRGITLPPHGKMSVVYRAALEHQKGPFSGAWYYLNGPYSKFKGKSELARALMVEAFANGAFLMCDPHNANNVAGSTEDHAWWNLFIQKNRSAFGIRLQMADTGLLFSPDNQLYLMAPGGFPDMDRQPHIFGHWGWATMMIDAHHPYQAVPDWKLDDRHLSRFKTLIVPDAICLEDAAAAAIQRWVEAGGNLVATGGIGLRYGPAGNFAKRAKPALESVLAPATSTGFVRYGRGSVRWSSEPLGMSYYLDIPGRAGRLPAMSAMLPQSSLLDGSGLPKEVGLFLWRSTEGDAVFADLVNFNVDIENDRVQPIEHLTFSLLYIKSSHSKVMTLSPDDVPPVEITTAPHRIEIRVPRLEHFVSVKVV